MLSQDAHKIQRIGSRYHHEFLLTGLVAQLAKSTNGIANRKLFARDSRDKSSAPNLATGLQTAINLD